MKQSLKHGFLIVTFIFCALVSKAEINVGYSIEWLCAKADVIVKGNITSVDMKDDNVVCSFDISDRYKGGLTQMSTEFTLVSGKNYDGNLKKYIMNGKELIVFLVKPGKDQKNVKTEYISMVEEGPGLFFIIDLSSPGNRLISASDFKVIKDELSIISKCKNIIGKFNDYIANHKRYEPQRNYLAIPLDTEAYKLLYSGSKCYLYVPDFLYKESKNKFY
ncbi:MAG: hypothetical protein HY958_11150 [Bacteroidia bacterium]|nr:hypothetical protein [Bacteroidia bacterium]